MSPPREAVSSVSIPRQNLSNAHPVRAGSLIVLHDLAKFGPGSSPSNLSLADSQEYCQNLAKNHYENFSIASFLIPKVLRQDFFNIYAYCRWSDDLADEMGSTGEATTLLRWWRHELAACFEGRRIHPVYVALGDTIDRHQLNEVPFTALLDAFMQDQVKSRYESDDEVLEYCKGSANPVGRILLQLARVNSIKAIEMSDSVCTGLQIANFCQDVKRDALRDRIYLPRDRWQKHQLNERLLLQANSTPELQAAIADWSDEAFQCLSSGLELVREVPRWLARDVQLFVRGGMAILRNIAKRDYDCWTKPIEVTKSQKLLLLLRALIAPRSVHVGRLQTNRYQRMQG